jgi:hypothetical protein
LHTQFFESITRIIEFQLNLIKNNIDSEVLEYENILNELNNIDYGNVNLGTDNIGPEKIILPYIFFQDEKSDAYKLNKQIWKKVSENYDDPPIYAVIAAYDPQGIDWQIISQDLSHNVEGVILWFSEIDEMNSPVNKLVNLRKVCKTLSNNNINVCIHAGGAFSMGLAFDGVNSIAAGITYGERRRLDLTAGGPVPQKYFIPQLLTSFPYGETKLAISKIGLDCKNPCCSGFDEKIDQFMRNFFPGKRETSWGPTTQTKLHYLYRFKQKMAEIWEEGRDQGISKLISLKEEMSEKLPSRFWQHFENWIKAYESNI